MFGFYTPILLLQAFCVYHAYRNNAENRWYWLILLFPLIGCVIYLIHNFNNRATIDSLTENVKEVVISNYRIEQLEKALRFSDNLRNKTNLADAYMDFGRYKDAITLYNSCLQGFMSEDPSIRMKVLKAHFMEGDYNQVIEAGSSLEREKVFRDSEERVAYAWALFLVGKVDPADKIFEDMDRSFTNHYHRLEYCKYLIKVEKPESAKEKLKDLLEEFDQMQYIERRSKKSLLREVRDLYENYSTVA